MVVYEIPHLLQSIQIASPTFSYVLPQNLALFQTSRWNSNLPTRLNLLFPTNIQFFGERQIAVVILSPDIGQQPAALPYQLE